VGVTLSLSPPITKDEMIEAVIDGLM